MKTKILLLAIFIVTVSFTVFWQTKKQKINYELEVFAPNNIALKGYDMVALVKNGSIEKGTQTHSWLWNNVNWYFVSAENKTAFMQNPEIYVPQYGGYCAYGTSQGYKAPTQIETWTIVNGKLYFNYNREVKQLWQKNKESYIEKADQNWIIIKNKNKTS